MLVSIVVPAYNVAETLEETLQSLCVQTYQDLEIIVIDDGSKDATAEVARKFSSRVVYHRQENAGQAAALNRGWSMSKGQYIGYLSGDDILYPQAVEKLAQAMDQDPMLWVLYPDYDLIDAVSKKIREVRVPEFDAHALVEESLCQPGPGALFRREAFEKTGGWSTQLRLTPDFDFWVRVCPFGKMARFPEVLAGFRVHESSQSFAIPSEAKSEEPPNVIAAFFDKNPDQKKAFDSLRAKAWAHTLSARLHLRAGRWAKAIGHLLEALGAKPSITLRVRFWHLLLSGGLGRLRYQLTSSTRKS